MKNPNATDASSLYFAKRRGRGRGGGEVGRFRPFPLPRCFFLITGPNRPRNYCPRIREEKSGQKSGNDQRIRSRADRRERRRILSRCRHFDETANRECFPLDRDDLLLLLPPPFPARVGRVEIFPFPLNEGGRGGGGGGVSIPFAVKQYYVVKFMAPPPPLASPLQCALGATAESINDMRNTRGVIAGATPAPTMIHGLTDTASFLISLPLLFSSRKSPRPWRVSHDDSFSNIETFEIPWMEIFFIP